MPSEKVSIITTVLMTALGFNSPPTSPRSAIEREASLLLSQEEMSASEAGHHKVHRGDTVFPPEVGLIAGLLSPGAIRKIETLKQRKFVAQQP